MTNATLYRNRAFTQANPARIWHLNCRGSIFWGKDLTSPRPGMPPGAAACPGRGRRFLAPPASRTTAPSAWSCWPYPSSGRTPSPPGTKDFWLIMDSRLARDEG